MFEDPIVARGKNNSGKRVLNFASSRDIIGGPLMFWIYDDDVSIASRGPLRTDRIIP